ncbi:MAG: IS200/IS605 family transposase [Planctomycetaceae bacterium]|nr:IS200/IS605 family transposase [Planctomycetaceae bacterium]
MAHNYYSEINLHITWHTKDSLPLLTPTVEPLLHRYIKQRLINEKGVFFHEIGGIETHVHLVVAVPPTISVSEWIGQLKGASAHEVNQQIGLRDKPLQWQTGYGVVSFGTGDLDWVKEYVRNQQRHHAEGKTFDRLERFAVIEEEQDARERA